MKQQKDFRQRCDKFYLILKRFFWKEWYIIAFISNFFNNFTVSDISFQYKLYIKYM